MLERITTIAQDAGAIIMDYRDKGFSTQTKKYDKDFVTDADFAADNYITTQLKSLFPEDAILTEESVDKPLDLSDRVWIVDPLDGTRDFVEGGDGFSVMIALCKAGAPVLGVVYAPVKGKLYTASAGHGAYMEQGGVKMRLEVDPEPSLASSIHVDRVPTEPRDLDYMVEDFPVAARVQMSSIGLKLGLIASGNAHTSINTNYLCSTWDTCAPQIILEEAGGKVTDFSGKPIDYTQSDPLLRNSFVASNGVLHDAALRHVQKYGK